MERITLSTPASAGYELLDAGGEEKLERFGDYILMRPDPQALWPKSLDSAVWDTAHAWYERTGKDGVWHTSKDLPKEWQVAFGGLTLQIRPTSFKHTGLFPEQLSNWDWVRQVISSRSNSSGVHEFSAENSLNSPAVAVESLQQTSSASVKVLNLFGYTGGATLAAAQAGAEVAHVDASKSAVEWARKNAELSGLGDKPIRWIIEDAMLFVEREVRRGNKYDGIIMDPPSFGHGPKTEIWKIEEHLLPLVEQCKQLVSDKPLFFLINGYAAGYSPLALAYNLEDLVGKYGGSLEYGDLTIAQSNSRRVLPAGIFARWKS